MSWSNETKMAFHVYRIHQLHDVIDHLEKCKNRDVEKGFVCLYNKTLKTFVSSESEYGAWPNPETADLMSLESAECLCQFISCNAGYFQPMNFEEAIDYLIADQLYKLEEIEKES